MTDFVGFNHASFPHLLTSIIESSDHSTLLALRQTSTCISREVDRQLFRHALVMRPQWPSSTSPLCVGGSGPRRQLPIPRADDPSSVTRLTSLLSTIQVLDDVSGGMLVGWRKSLLPRIVRRKGLAEQTLCAPCVIDSVDLPFNDNANWVVTSSMQKVPQGVERYTAHVRVLSPPSDQTPGNQLGPANVKFGKELPQSVREVNMLFTPVWLDCPNFEPLHYYHEHDGRKVNMLSIVVEQIAADLAERAQRAAGAGAGAKRAEGEMEGKAEGEGEGEERRYAFVGLEDIPGHVYDRALGDETVEENFRRRLVEELEVTTENAGEIVERHVRVLSREEYRREVGEERFELESGWDGVLGAPRCL